MSHSITTELVLKDWRIMRTPTLLYWAAGFAAIIVAVIGGEAFGTISFIMFIAAMAGAGIHCLMATIVVERTEMNLPFIMSLPVTVKEFTQAKLVVNLTIFISVWVTLAAASLLIFIGPDSMPMGTLPFFCIILVAILMAYVIMLAVTMLSGSQGWAIGSTVVANIGTQVYLWFIADLHGIRSVIGGPEAVWTSTAVTVLVGEIALILALLWLTYALQSRKKDFV